jgi:uncharacterized SAM-binding protein YcdF (DUF218 family)
MNYFYNTLLALVQPIPFCLLLLFAMAALSRPKSVKRMCFWMAVAVLLFCGNKWVVEGLARPLEGRYLPPDPIPEADCILVLSGGTLARLPPRSTVEVGDAGDRVLYGATLYRKGRAPRIICTGNVATGAIAVRPAAQDMAELLEMLGVPRAAIILETKARNTHEHATNLYPLLQEQGFKRVLLVTSAMHMPRSVGVFKQLCPGIEFVPAPTDFRATERVPAPWYHELTNVIPTPRDLLNFSEVMHEYFGIAYYRMRDWM